MDYLSIKNVPNPVRLLLDLLSNQSPAAPEALHSTEMLCSILLGTPLCREERREFVGFGRSKAIEYFCGVVADSEQCRKLCTIFAAATASSFTGETLADKFGRTKAFQLDAIPLAVGAFLTLINGCLLAGIGIGVSSAIVPLYISEVEDNVWHCNYALCSIGTKNGIFSRKPKVALSGFLVQGKFSEAKMAIKRLFGKERVAEKVICLLLLNKREGQISDCPCRINCKTKYSALGDMICLEREFVEDILMSF
ncbi:hypothetical protein RHSIM_Rhsim03G0249100 [Rhododendron simsii]|uniref:Uncharacterized protein n=1 Tax=Rhododendron simsii TaxID=118357 RepID=A0A834LUS1_RHOSS|nr:hypothetical protein RHSIM_Rhsim03G0249100 [Rhododendron simsii]